MSPERVAALVARWVRLYTAGLPASVARRRIEEIDADLHDHIAHERALGTSDRRIALAIASRVLRGAVADVTWRGHETRAARTRSIKEPTMKTLSLGRSALRVTAAVLAVLAIPLVGMALSDDVAWSVADFVLAGVLLSIIGVSFELAARRRGNVLVGLALAGLGVAAAVIGEVDDAPGLVLLGALLIVGGGLITYRRLQRAQ
jgi:hypothetical protein